MPIGLGIIEIEDIADDIVWVDLLVTAVQGNLAVREQFPGNVRTKLKWNKDVAVKFLLGEVIHRSHGVNRLRHGNLPELVTNRPSDRDTSKHDPGREPEVAPAMSEP